MRVFRSALIAAVFLVPGLTAGLLAQGNSQPPAQAQIDFATQSADLMQATLFAALLQEFAETTPANVPQGIQSIGLIFDDRNDNMRLVGTNQPLSANDTPQDGFENSALTSALIGQGATIVERVSGKWYYRRSIPLSNFHPACSMCHTNFGPVNPAQWVGALMLRVPIPKS